MSNRNDLQEQITSKAIEDSGFRQALLENPAATIAKELGTNIPGEINIQVLEETSSTLYIVLPPSEEAEISEAELESVAGGAPRICSAGARW